MALHITPITYINVYIYREERKEIIREKYMEKAFVQQYCSNAKEFYAEMENAIDSHSIEDLLQCQAECHHLGIDITDPLPSSVSVHFILHKMYIYLFLITFSGI